MIEPYLKNDALLHDLETTLLTEPDALHLWWLGQSGYLVAHQGQRLLLDPYLSDSLTQKYAASDKPHTRMTERVIDPERLDQISLVTASHQHTDHLDRETLTPVLAKNPDAYLVAPRAHLALAKERAGSERVVPLNPGESFESGSGIRITAVPAAHETLDTDQAGNALYLGFVIQLAGWTLYHSGDTVLYPGMVEQLRPFNIDVAFLPINGRRPERRVSGNLWGDEAAQLAWAIGATLVIPGHYELFTFNTEPPDLFIRTCERLGQPYRVLRAGERASLAR